MRFTKGKGQDQDLLSSASRCFIYIARFPTRSSATFVWYCLHRFLIECSPAVAQYSAIYITSLYSKHAGVHDFKVGMRVMQAVKACSFAGG